MTSANMNLSLTLSARDNGARDLLRRVHQEISRNDSLRRRLAHVDGRMAQLGIRSERQIRMEILQTQAAYNRLARSGRASHNDLARAATATRNRIRELNDELRQGAGGWRSRMGAIGRGAATVAAGSAAAYAAVRPEVERYKALDMRLREVTWAAHGETRGADTAWLQTQGMAQTKALALALVQQNGGSSDLALDTMAGMLANGMSWADVQKNAAATHAMARAAGENGQYDGAAAAKLAKTFADNGLDVARASQMAAQSGMQGTFEIANMVRDLPSLLPDAKAAGFSGEAGLAYLLSALQSASNKAGTPDEAANNVKNVLQKTLSADTTKRMDKLLKTSGSKADWQKMVLEGQKQGKNAVQVLADFAQTLLSKDKGFQAVKARADKGDELAQQQMATMQAFMVSKLMPDMQARAGLNAMLDAEQMRQYFDGLMGNKTDVIGGKNQFMALGEAAKQEKAQAEKELSLQSSQFFATVAEGETKLAQLTAQFPVATEALKALAAAASAAALAQGAMAMLGRGGGAGGAMGRMGGWLRGAAASVGGWFAARGAQASVAATRAGQAIGGVVRAAGGWLGGMGRNALGAVANNPTALGKWGAAGLLLHSGSLNAGESELLARAQAQRGRQPNIIRFGQPNNAASAARAESAEKLAPVISQQTAAYQTATQAQTASFQ
ncbi:phage tail tape measure protein, partial [Kingella oralis]|uniref:phage tail tape measure protein n=1 Tax=Kingella oralis TaxID=505 RepID=UPI0034E4AEE1